MAEMVKEKLVELVRNVRSRSSVWDTTGDIADYIIAHGVTVQEWISVEDRLPTTFVSVLGYMTDAGEFPAIRECYCAGGNEFYFPALFERHPVSHWMPMPQPPKGE